VQKFTDAPGEITAEIIRYKFEQFHCRTPCLHPASKHLEAPSIDGRHGMVLLSHFCHLDGNGEAAAISIMDPTESPCFLVYRSSISHR